MTETLDYRPDAEAPKLRRGQATLADEAPASTRKRGRRKAGAASSVAVSPDTADRIDRLVEALSEQFTVSRMQVVEMAIRHLQAEMFVKAAAARSKAEAAP